MQKLLNTLYITNENAVLSLDGETVYVEVDKQKVGQFPLHTIEQIVSFSYYGATTMLISKCIENNIGMSFYNPNGKFLYRVNGKNNGNVFLRKEQYRISDSVEKSFEVAKNFIIGKVHNSRWTLDRTLRDHKMRVSADMIDKAIVTENNGIKLIKESNNLDSLRGIEGECASAYFDVFDELILNQKEDFIFNGRSKRPPLDNVNAMLSFGYSLLANDCASALEGVGLDSYVGFMHRDRSGRQSLALDLMEELRSILVDRFVITLINTKQIKAENFDKQSNGSILFTSEGRKAFISAWQAHKREEIRHPFLKEKIVWGLVPHIQAKLLARYIRGDLDGYPPFLWK